MTEREGRGSMIEDEGDDCGGGTMIEQGHNDRRGGRGGGLMAKLEDK